MAAVPVQFMDVPFLRRSFRNASPYVRGYFNLNHGNTVAFALEVRDLIGLPISKGLAHALVLELLSILAKESMLVVGAHPIIPGLVENYFERANIAGWDFERSLDLVEFAEELRNLEQIGANDSQIVYSSMKQFTVRNNLATQLQHLIPDLDFDFLLAYPGPYSLFTQEQHNALIRAIEIWGFYPQTIPELANHVAGKTRLQVIRHFYSIGLFVLGNMVNMVRRFPY